MFLKKKDLKPMEFDDLKIFDYTAELEFSSSFAEISVPAGIRHKVSWSRRSDKYYYVVQGTVQFIIGEENTTLSAGDFCIVPKGVRFTYRNNEPNEAKLILIHTPGFKLEFEVFE